jgi:hypothetical protein
MADPADRSIEDREAELMDLWQSLRGRPNTDEILQMVSNPGAPDDTQPQEFHPPASNDQTGDPELVLEEIENLQERLQELRGMAGKSTENPSGTTSICSSR